MVALWTNQFLKAGNDYLSPLLIENFDRTYHKDFYLLPTAKMLSSKTDANYRKRWGYSFQWTDKHLAPEEIAALRSHYDEIGSTALEKLQAIIARTKTDSKREVNCPFRPELYTVFKKHHHEDEVLQQFWDEVHSVPEWVDWEQIERAQKFFARYALANSTAFALQGFIRENSVRFIFLRSSRSY